MHLPVCEVLLPCVLHVLSLDAALERHVHVGRHDWCWFLSGRVLKMKLSLDRSVFGVKGSSQELMSHGSVIFCFHLYSHRSPLSQSEAWAAEQQCVDEWIGGMFSSLPSAIRSLIFIFMNVGTQDRSSSHKMVSSRILHLQLCTGHRTYALEICLKAMKNVKNYAFQQRFTFNFCLYIQYMIRSQRHEMQRQESESTILSLGLKK